MSQFAFLFHGAPPTGTPAELSAQNEKWAVWMRELGEKGHLANPGQPLQPKGMLVTDRRGTASELRVDSGIVGGVMFIEAKDMDQAVAISTGSPIFDAGGTVEVRPVMKL